MVLNMTSNSECLISSAFPEQTFLNKALSLLMQGGKSIFLRQAYTEIFEKTTTI